MPRNPNRRVRTKTTWPMPSGRLYRPGLHDQRDTWAPPGWLLLVLLAAWLLLIIIISTTR
jgi:hypothetical protein